MSTTMEAMDDVGRRGASASLPSTTFAQLPLRTELQRALQAMRFHAPSPIQLRALPLALFGSDVIGQAKSGTGKTAVFGLAAVEHVLQRVQPTGAVVPSDPLVLILAPTREIAMQIDSVLRQLAAESESVRIVPLIGGLPIAQDQKRLRAGCHIAVGTPGRVRWLIEDGVLRPKAIRLLVFDEVDKLLSGEFVVDIDAIVAAIPERRQTLAFSATFTPDQLVHVVQMMRDPQVVRVRGPSDVTVELVPSQEKELAEWIEREKQHEPELWLRHVRQFYRVVPAKTETTNDPLNLKSKLVLLASLLSEIAFHQCIVFCNDKFRAEALATALESQGWPAAAITGAQPQATRNAVMDQFRACALRVLVSTDLTARGIDVEKVNFVVNLDLPRDPATYLHRHGLAVTLLTASDVEGIRLLSRVFKMSVDELPSPAPRDIRGYVVSVDASVETESSDRFNGSVTRDENDDGNSVGEVTSDEESVEDDEEEDDDDGVEEGKVEEVHGQESDGTGVIEEVSRTNGFRPERRRPEQEAREDTTSVLTRRREDTSSVKNSTAAFVNWEDHCYKQWLRLLPTSSA